MKLVLVSTLNCPGSKMFSLVKRTIKIQNKYFCDSNISITRNSDKNLINLLKGNNVNLILIDMVPLGMSLHRKLVLIDGLKRNPDSEYFLHIDYDRLIHWLISFPEEFSGFIQNFPKKFDFLSLGRTKRAFNTHPKIQQRAENWTNSELKKVLGIKLDTTSSCYLLRRHAAEAIVKTTKEKNCLSSTDGEWPAICKKEGFSLGYLPVEGLEFETADIHQKEIKKAGSLKKWFQINYEKNKNSIENRWKIAQESVKIAREILKT